VEIAGAGKTIGRGQLSSRYQVTLDEDTYDLLRSALSSTLKRLGFKEGISVVRMEGASVVEFRKKASRVTLQSHSIGADKLQVVVETDTGDVEALIVDVIERTALRLLWALCSPLGLEARERLARELRDMLQKLPPYGSGECDLRQPQSPPGMLLDMIWRVKN
jgi:hypothetical protein